MIILSHRGYWATQAEKNTPEAFRRSFDLGFGTELDIRDDRGRLVIAHDLPTGNEPSFEDILSIMGGRNLTLAINIKADGLGALLKKHLDRAGHSNWFTFDMSVPDLINQLGLGLFAFTRASEFEQSPACYKETVGVWLDGFQTDWYSPEHVAAFLKDGKRVCVVSPELHTRNPQALWDMLRATKLSDDPNLLMCTDQPEVAAAFFAREA